MAVITAASIAQSDVQAALNLAVAGDTVIIPPGTDTWCNGVAIGVPAGVKLFGSGIDVTTINISINCGQYTNGMVFLGANSTFGYATINGQNFSKTAFIGNGNGFRVTGVKYNGIAGEAYFLYGNQTYGLIDNCIINGGAGNSELIFTRGPSNAWQTPSTLGTDQAVYIEDCIFNGAGYVSDFNANSKGVVRFCTIQAPMKVDGHGVASNTPARGVRHLEIYKNTWTWPNNNWTNIEFRGGTGMIFANRAPNVPAGNLWFWLKEYGCTYQYANFNYTYQTPINYPILDQVGTGQDPRVGGSEPLYIWDNKAKNNQDMILNWYADLTNAINLYRTQTGNPSASFAMYDIIYPDRDYFREDSTQVFNGSTGVGRGTKAQMQAIAPTKTGVGFWVTDEGSWNKMPGGEQGRLYTWSGSSWNLYYEPYTYPHPLRGYAASRLKRVRGHLKLKVFS